MLEAVVVTIRAVAMTKVVRTSYSHLIALANSIHSAVEKNKITGLGRLSQTL